MEIARAAINRIKTLTRTLLSTGDDDGVVKVNTFCFSELSVTRFILRHSSGIPENKMLFAHTTTILTSYPTLCG